MSEPFTAVKGSRKIKRDFLASRSSIYSGNSSLEVHGGRVTLPVIKGQKLSSNTSSDKMSFLSEKEDLAFDEYELEYSTYLLRKLQNRLLTTNKKKKEENFKKCLVSFKLELEDLLKKHTVLSKTSMYIEMYMKIVKECNKRIQLGNILKVFEENKLDVLFNSVCRMLDQAINQLTLININKNEVEKVFKEDIGEDSQLVECLNKIYNHASRNREKIEAIAMEIIKIEKLFKENSLLRERYQSKFDSITKDILEASYETLTDIVRKAFTRKLNNHVESNQENSEVVKLDELIQATLQPFPIQHTNSLHLSKIESVCGEKPSGTSTPNYAHSA